MSSQRYVYIDFLDGNGFIDVSDFVKYDTLSIQETAFNDTFHAAQNTCSFSVIYDTSIYTKITTNTKNLPLRIFDLREEAAIHTEADQPILTENGVRLLIETSVAVPVFAGHIPPKSSREYNGILDNTIIKINATDDLDHFDVPVGDVLYANCAVMNPSDPANSIVHKLALIAGWTTSMVSSVSIPTVIARYSPSDEKATVRSILDTLLYEYGYTLFLNENGDLAPIQWDRSIPSSTILEFNEDNIIDEISIENSTRKYDGVKVVYYDLNSVDNMRLYRDSNCGYASDGSFAGYAILDNTDYPPAANAIDETTGNKQIVYQEYTDDAIKYATNKAIQQNLDYNYKNYSSDFTSIVATENYYVDRRFQSPITIVTEAFANKKCQLLYRNTTGSPVLLYYNDVYATIWYKSAEHTAIKDIATTPSDVYEYTSSYIFNKAVGDELALAIAAQYKNGLRTYEHTSENDYHCGDIVRIVLSGEGTNTYALVQNKAWDEKDQLYTYSCMSYNPTRETLTSQNVIEVGAINSAESYASVHSIGTPEAVATTVQPIIVEHTPKYLGMYLDGVPTSFNTGDWCTRYSATNGTAHRGVFVRGTSSWTRTEDSRYLGNGAINDILKITTNPVVMTSSSAPSGTWVNQLGLYSTQMYIWNGSVWSTISTISYGAVSDYGATYYENLFSRFIKVLTGGSIYGGDRFDSTGTEVDNSKAGFYLGSDGILKTGQGNFTGTVNAINGNFSGDITVSGSLTAENAAQQTIIDPAGIAVFSKADSNTMYLDERGISVYNSLGQLDGFFRGSVTNTKLSSAYRFRTKTFYQVVMSSWDTVLNGNDYYSSTSGTRYVGAFVLSFETYTVAHHKCGFMADIMVSHFMPGATIPTLTLSVRGVHSETSATVAAGEFIRIDGSSVQVQNTGGQYIYCSILAIG